MDTLHKVLWIKLLEEMFLGMPSEYPWGDEMMLFLNVFNGALLLHPEDSSLLRQYTATAINTAVHFNHLFSLSGYQWILPTMLQVVNSATVFKTRVLPLVKSPTIVQESDSLPPKNVSSLYCHDRSMQTMRATLY